MQTFFGFVEMKAQNPFPKNLLHWRVRFEEVLLLQVAVQITEPPTQPPQGARIFWVTRMPVKEHLSVAVILQEREMPRVLGGPRPQKLRRPSATSYRRRMGNQALVQWLNQWQQLAASSSHAVMHLLSAPMIASRDGSSWVTSNLTVSLHLTG